MFELLDGDCARASESAWGIVRLGRRGVNAATGTAVCQVDDASGATGFGRCQIGVRMAPLGRSPGNCRHLQLGMLFAKTTVMPLRLLFARVMPWVTLGCLVVCVYLQAIGGSSLFASFALPRQPNVLPYVGSSKPAAVRQHLTASALFVHNPFDWRVDLDPPPAVGTTPNDEPAVNRERGNPLLAATCNDVAASIVTESADPTWSVSVLHTNSDGTALARRVGDPVGDYEVAYIGFNHFKASPAVWLVNDQSLCQVLLFGQKATSQEVAQATRAADTATTDSALRRKARTSKAALPLEIAERILWVSDTQVVVERSVVDQVLADPAAFMGSARVLPAKEGETRTPVIRLTGVREGTLLHALNLRTGDVLTRINGYDLSSPEQALNAYARLRTAQELSLDVVRQGKPTSLRVTIR